MKQHTIYLSSSPYYASLYETFGRFMPASAAIRQAKDHDTTLAELDIPLYPGNVVPTLAFVKALGY